MEIKEIKQKLEMYLVSNDVNQYMMLLDAADLFIEKYFKGANSEDELDLGISLFRELAGLTYIGTLHEYEYDYDLQNKILTKKIKVFKTCIPSSHAKLKGLTEMLIGMKENELS